MVRWQQLPEEFATLRRLLEARMGKPGKREFVQVLRLLEVFRLDDGMLAGVREAIARGVIGFDAVKHLVLCRIEQRPLRLNLQVYPYLPQAAVATTLAKAYLSLMAGAASVSDAPQVLLTHYLKTLRLPTFPRRAKSTTAGAWCAEAGRSIILATCCV